MRRVVLVLAAVPLTALAGGCAPHAPSAPAAPPPPAARSLEETAAPPWPSRAMTLPAGCDVTDHTARLAVVRRNTMREYPSAALGLLDLRTGRYAEVVTAPVSAAERFDVLGRAVSDRWLAWEEVSSDESAWRLYAAPVDAARLTIGPPSLVDSARSAARDRPLFGLADSALVWTCPEVADGRPRAVVRVRDLARGRTSVVHRGSRPLKAARLRDGVLVLTTEAVGGNASVVTLIDPGSGRMLGETPMDNVGPASHFADAEGPLSAWAAYESSGAPWPAVYARDAGGTSRIESLGCDPTLRAGLVLFESYDPPSSSGGVRGADLTAGTRFTLVPPGPQHSPSWQLCATASSPGGTLLAWSDGLSRAEPGRAAVTRVLVWDTR